MKTNAAKAPPAEQAPSAATAEEILRAIEGIGQGDLLRLDQFARNRIARIGPTAACRREARDLFQEAVTRLMDGRRNWTPAKVDLVGCLLGIIQSIASEWAADYSRNSADQDHAALECEYTSEARPESPFQKVPTDSLNVEQLAIEADIREERKALAHKLEEAFADDEDAGMVMLAWQDGMNGPAIQKELNWTEPEYRTVVRRIKRRAQNIAKEHYGK